VAGKHRGPTHSGKASRYARFAWPTETESAVRRIATMEQRSYGNTISVLVQEALASRARRRRRSGTR
jgi:hypothetical protein